MQTTFWCAIRQQCGGVCILRQHRVERLAQRRVRALFGRVWQHVQMPANRHTHGIVLASVRLRALATMQRLEQRTHQRLVNMNHIVASLQLT